MKPIIDERLLKMTQVFPVNSEPSTSACFSQKSGKTTIVFPNNHGNCTWIFKLKSIPHFRATPPILPPCVWRLKTWGGAIMITTTTTIIKITTIITEQGDLEAHRRTEGLCGRTELQAIL